MPYMLLIHEAPDQRAARSEAEGRVLYDSMPRWGEELRRRDLLIGAESLASLDGAARVSTVGGKVRIVDGPFAEVKEMLGGFFLLRVESREQALVLAAECPAAAWATVEVRALAPCFMR